MGRCARELARPDDRPAPVAQRLRGGVWGASRKWWWWQSWSEPARIPVTNVHYSTSPGENIAGAQRAIEVSPSLALTGAYDAVRHCVDAHLNANGFRAMSGEAAHRFRVEYARVAMSSIISDTDLEKYQVARQVRHEAEYPSPERPLDLPQADALQMISLALTFHKAVSGFLRSRP